MNGRGQLGDVLTKELNNYSDVKEDIYIYHTWRLDTKDYEEQFNEFEKFKNFVDEKNSNLIAG